MVSTVNKPEFPTREYTIRDQYKWSFTVVINTVYYVIVKNNEGEEKGA